MGSCLSVFYHLQLFQEEVMMRTEISGGWGEGETIPNMTVSMKESQFPEIITSIVHKSSVTLSCL